MSKKAHLVLCLALLSALSACSSSKVSNTDDALLMADAGTDAVPAGSAEDLSVTEPVAPADSSEAAPRIDPMPTADQSAAAAPPLTESPPQAAVPESKPDLAQAQPKLSEPEAQTPPAVTPPVVEQPKREVRPQPSVASVPSGSGVEVYQTRRGDTLMKIAFKVYGDLFRWKDIFEANRDRIKNPNQLAIGMSLHIEKPSESVAHSFKGEKYKIKPGDTMGTIAENVYGTPKKWRKIWKANQTWVPNPNRIFAGFYVYYTMTKKDRENYARLKGSTRVAEAVAEQKQEPKEQAVREMGNTEDRMPASLPQNPPAPAAQESAMPPLPSTVQAVGMPGSK